MTIKEITAYRLKQARLYRDMSFWELANACELTASTIYVWELSGIPKLEKTVPKLAKALDLPESYFTDEPKIMVTNPYLSVWLYKGLITIEKLNELEKDTLIFSNS
jgi:transcriptional regulator with XRE-family HTH domain